MDASFLGKRTDRLRVPRQLGFDPELGHEIRARAARSRRTIEGQLLHLIIIGLKHDTSNEQASLALHTAAHDGTSESEAMHGAAPKRTQPHTAARKKAVSA